MTNSTVNIINQQKQLRETEEREKGWREYEWDGKWWKWWKRWCVCDEHMSKTMNAKNKNGGTEEEKKKKD